MSAPLIQSEIAIDVQDLKKHFADKMAVNGVSIRMPKGRVWGFLGPNGSGKTTTIRMMCGLLKPTEGKGTCLGYDLVKQAEEIKKQTGYMTQRFSFWQDLSLRENLEFVARMYHLPKRRHVVEATLEKLGLAHRQKQLCGALSGGWKQRLALAAVTMHEPKLLLLDEPTAGVDPQARREFWDQIHDLTQQGMTILVSTHYMDEAERCDEIVYLAHGNLIAQGPVAEVVRSSGLITFKASGPDVRQILNQIRGRAGVEHAAYFGSAIHVSGTHREKLTASIEQFRRPDVHWEEVAPSLEDTFIALMAQAGVDKRGY